MSEETILIIDDEKSARFFLEFHLKEWGYTPLLAGGAEEAMKILKKNLVDLIISDQVMPRMDGLEFLGKVKEKYGHVPFIMLTAHGCVKKAVISMRHGADDYLQKPCDLDELKATILRSLNYSRLNEKNKKLKDCLSSLYSFQNIVTRSPIHRNALKFAEKVAKNPNSAVAIYGESGTGKEILARAIHFAGDKMENKFVTVNCAGIPSGLLESELFGHVKGAFTGADRSREGKFEFANQGTILLDEIGDMPLDIQPKLLRALQERVYEKVGSNKTLKVKARIIVATHRDLNKMVQEGKFREDLFHRVNSFPITLPPLRERKEDIPLLANYFIDQLRKELGKQLPGISQKAMDLLLNYPWPGNIRELKNCLERAAILVDDELIKPNHLIIKDRAQKTDENSLSETGNIRMDIDLPPGSFSLESVINRTLSIALERCGDNKSAAADFLKVDRKIFYRRTKFWK